MSRPRINARALARGAHVASITIAVAAFFWHAPIDGSATEAASTVTIPACAPNHAGGAGIPSAMPLRDAGAPPAPFVTAKSAVVVDAETGRVLYGLNEHDRRAPASTTKIMTAILALEDGPLDRQVIAQSNAVRMSQAGSSVMGLMPGTSITVRDLLYGVMLPSGNDAALDVARAVAGGSVPEFVTRMNAKAAALGLDDTKFRNPHGLDARGHYSTAYDLAMLGRYAMANEEFRRIASAQWHHLAPPSDYDLQNGNSLLSVFPGADGIKIGWTNRAGWTLVASAIRDGRRVLVTVLNSEDRNADAAALLDWAFSSHRWVGVGSETQQIVRALDRFGLGRPLARALRVCA